MEQSNPAEQLLDLWKRQIEEGTQAWTKLIASAPTPGSVDPTAFWRPLMDQGVASWSRLMSQGPASPDLMDQWKRFLDQWIEAWSKALAQAMGTEAFAQALGRYLDQWLVNQGPVKKAAEQSTEAVLQSLGLPSRTQITNIARQLVELEERLERLEDRITAMPRWREPTEPP